jgi:hypothetical protein
VIIAIDAGPAGPRARLFRKGGEAREVALAMDLPPLANGDANVHVLAGVWNAGDPPGGRWHAVFDGVIAQDQPGDAPVRSMAYCVGPGIALAAVNYPGGADALDAEVVRGFALHWQFVRRVAASAREIEEAFEYTIAALARAAEAYDDDVAIHLQRVNEYSRELAEFIGMSPSYVRAIRIQAQMHDVGKIHVPLEVLQKPTDLTPDEDAVLQAHTTEGAHILGDHPRWDGSGYPQGLAAEAIPLEGRIVKLADVYDAMRSLRAYKPAFAHRDAIESIVKGDGRIQPSHFDPALLDAFQRVAPRFDEIYERMTKGVAAAKAKEPLAGSRISGVRPRL